MGECASTSKVNIFIRARCRLPLIGMDGLEIVVGGASVFSVLTPPFTAMKTGVIFVLSNPLIYKAF